MINSHVEQSELGKTTKYIDVYTPSLLFPIPRQEKRTEVGISGDLPFRGVDIWNAYELSWLNERGKPVIAIAKFTFPAQSTHIIESKSFKLYLNSFNQTQFASNEAVEKALCDDLSAAAGCSVGVTLLQDTMSDCRIGQWQGICLDDLDVAISDYELQEQYLVCHSDFTDEKLYSH